MRAPVTLLLAGLALAAASCGTPSPGEPAAAADSSATLPDLRGKSLEHARERADAGGWDLESSGLGGGTCADSETCVVYRMEPEPGAPVQAGTEVTVGFLSRAEQKWYAKHRKMPRLSGLPEEKALQLLKPVMAAVDAETEESAKAPAGTVIRQQPKAGKPLKMGQPIELTVSRGPSDTSADPGDPDVNVDNHDGETRFCSRRKWC